MKTHMLSNFTPDMTFCSRLVEDDQLQFPNIKNRGALLAVEDWNKVDCVDCLKRKPVSSHPALATNLYHRRKWYPKGPGAKCGLSLEQLASLSGVSKSQIWVIENTNASPSVITLMKLVNALNTTIYALLGIPEIGDFETEDQVFICKYMALNDIEKIYVRAISDVFHHKSTNKP